MRLWFVLPRGLDESVALVRNSAATGFDTTYSPGRSLEFAATFQPVNDQSVGFSVTMGDYPFATFTTGRSSDPVLFLYTPHDIRILDGSSGTSAVDGDL